MSVVFTVVSAILLVTVFATGAFVGYLATGRSSRSARAANPPIRGPAAPTAQVLDQFRHLVERLEGRLPQPDRPAAEDAVEFAAADDATAIDDDSNQPNAVRRELADILPDVERHLNDVLTEIRRAQDALGGSDLQDETPPQTEEESSETRREAGPASEELAAQATATNPDAEISERRSRMRHSFCCKQWVAPYNGRSVPGPDEFHYVQCNDISSVGISFFMDADPNCQLVVIRLASQKGAKFLSARVRRVTPSGNPHQDSFTIGCQFLGTIRFEMLPPRLDLSIVRRERKGMLESPNSPATTSA